MRASWLTLAPVCCGTDFYTAVVVLEIVPNRLFINTELVSLCQDHQVSFAVTIEDVTASWDLGKIGSDWDSVKY